MVVRKNNVALITIFQLYNLLFPDNNMEYIKIKMKTRERERERR